MALPLKKTVFVTVLAAALTMGILLLLGIRQTQLYRNHEEITSRTEKVVFQFSIIREHITEALLMGRYDKLAGVAGELEDLNGNLSRILARREISEEYKLSLFNAIDLPGIILRVRNMESGPVSPESLRQLNGEIRTLNERLLLFDRVLVNQAKQRLINFQNVVIGGLALMVSFAVGVLLLLQRRLIGPLILFGREMDKALREDGELTPDAHGNKEIVGIRRGVVELFTECRKLKQEAARRQQMVMAINQAQQAINGSRDKKKLYKDICRSLLLNPEYCLVWIGEPDAEADNQALMPVSADGSMTMSNEECETCITVLLTEAEEKGQERNPPVMALRTGKPVVEKNILAGIPGGLLKGTPLADGNAACAALPIQWQDRVYGVISIYALGEGFSDKELDLLQALAGQAGLAMAALEKQKQTANTTNYVCTSRLATLGELATGVAHEVSDLSNGMINYSQVLADEIPEDSTQAALLQKIIGSGEHISDLVKKIIFYGQEEEPGEYLPLADVLDDAVALAGYYLRKDGIQLEVHLPKDFPSLPVHAHQMQQVFLNLFNNARRSLNQRYPGKDDNKRFRIEGQVIQAEKGGLLRLVFTDYGIGIESRYLDKVFDPDFKSRESGGGGGLNISREIIEQHGGSMEVESTLGEHTTISLEFPARG